MACRSGSGRGPRRNCTSKLLGVAEELDSVFRHSHRTQKPPLDEQIVVHEAHHAQAVEQTGVIIGETDRRRFTVLVGCAGHPNGTLIISELRWFADREERALGQGSHQWRLWPGNLRTQRSKKGSPNKSQWVLPAVEEASEDLISAMRKSAKKSHKAFHRSGQVGAECQLNCRK